MWEAMTESHNTNYIETSAKTGEHVLEMFDRTWES